MTFGPTTAANAIPHPSKTREKRIVAALWAKSPIKLPIMLMHPAKMSVVLTPSLRMIHAAGNASTMPTMANEATRYPALAGSMANAAASTVMMDATLFCR